jgi:hypothetical protein
LRCSAYKCFELGGDCAACFDAKSRLRGWRNLSYCALIMAGTAGLVDLRLESDAEKKRQALQCELEKKDDLSAGTCSADAGHAGASRATLFVQYAQ